MGFGLPPVDFESPQVYSSIVFIASRNGPPMTGFAITEFAAKSLDRGLFTPDLQPAHVATVVLEAGDTISLSRFATEAHWVMDAHFKANGFPVFSHGEGARYTALSVLKADHPLTAELDRRAREA